MKMITDKINLDSLIPGQEKYLVIRMGARKLCFYGFRLNNDKVFFTCSGTLKKCREQREEWVKYNTNNTEKESKTMMKANFLMQSGWMKLYSKAPYDKYLLFRDAIGIELHCGRPTLAWTESDLFKEFIRVLNGLAKKRLHSYYEVASTEKGNNLPPTEADLIPTSPPYSIFKIIDHLFTPDSVKDIEEADCCRLLRTYIRWTIDETNRNMKLADALHRAGRGQIELF